MGKLLAILLLFLVPYGIWKTIDFLTPDLCNYTQFRYDQRYYFQRYNSFWYGIYEYPSRKLFKKVYQTTPCNGDERLSEQEGSEEHLSIHWGRDDVLIEWRKSSGQPLEKKLIPNLMPRDGNNYEYEILYREKMDACTSYPENTNCNYNEERKLRDKENIPHDYLFIYNGTLEAQLECLKKHKIYPKDRLAIPEQCKAQKIVHIKGVRLD